MENIVYTDSLYTSAILELERAADFIEGLAFDEGGEVTRAFAAVVAAALRERCDKLRSDEAAGG